MSVGHDSRVRLGVFVVSGLVLAVAGVLALGAARIFERTVPLHLYFAETVQGLEEGSAISYRGVRLGRVSQILMREPVERGRTAMGRGALIEVVCELFPEQLTRFGGVRPSEDEIAGAIRREVTHGLRVRIAWKDITGQKYLDLDYVDPELDENVPPKLGFEPMEPYIPALASKSLVDIQRDLATTLGSLAKIDFAGLAARLQVLLEQLSQKVSEFRADEVSTSFRDAADAVRDISRSEDLKRALSRLDTITQEVQGLAKRANELLSKPEVEEGIADLGAAARSLRHAADELSARLPQSLEHFDAAVGDARKAFLDAKIPETTAALRTGIEDVSGIGRHVSAVREDLAQALREMGAASRSIARLAEYLERHPEAVLRGRDGGGGVGGQK